MSSMEESGLHKAVDFFFFIFRDFIENLTTRNLGQWGG